MRITVVGCVGRETFDKTVRFKADGQKGATGLIGAMD